MEIAHIKKNMTRALKSDDTIFILIYTWKLHT